MCCLREALGACWEHWSKRGDWTGDMAASGLVSQGGLVSVVRIWSAGK
jgi:hypothetical protein